MSRRTAFARWAPGIGREITLVGALVTALALVLALVLLLVLEPLNCIDA